MQDMDKIINFRFFLRVTILFFFSTSSSHGEFIFEDEFNDPQRDALIEGTFPEGFTWGVGSSAYQVEGAWNQDGKGPSAWDTFAHTPGKIQNNQSGDVACDSYHRYRDDVTMLSDLGVTHYRFSIAWSRIFPTGLSDKVNDAGVQYYHRLIDALVEAGIAPAITLYHSDMPQVLQEIGGWHNDMMITYFNDFADFCFKEYGHKVKVWFTINQPKLEAVFGYEEGIHPPGIKQRGMGAYRATHTMLKAHARAWHTYDTKYRASQRGQVSVVINSLWFEPVDDSAANAQAAERARQFDFGLVGNPIFGNGDYPTVLKEYIGNRSLSQGLWSSRLPAFTEEERSLLAGTGDFIAVNYYTSRFVQHKNPSDVKVASIDNDLGIEIGPSEDWPKTATPHIRIVPWGLRRLLAWIKKTYGDFPIYVTENGCAQPDDDEGDAANLDDDLRTKYLRAHINEALKASQMDGVNLRGYFAWSLMDSFEWNLGYSERFGLYHVDFDDDDRTRRPRSSATAYSSIIRNNGFKKEAVDEKDEL